MRTTSRRDNQLMQLKVAVDEENIAEIGCFLGGSSRHLVRVRRDAAYRASGHACLAVWMRGISARTGDAITVGQASCKLGVTALGAYRKQYAAKISAPQELKSSSLQLTVVKLCGEIALRRRGGNPCVRKNPDLSS